MQTRVFSSWRIHNSIGQSVGQYDRRFSIAVNCKYLSVFRVPSAVRLRRSGGASFFVPAIRQKRTVHKKFTIKSQNSPQTPIIFCRLHMIEHQFHPRRLDTAGKGTSPAGIDILTGKKEFVKESELESIHKEKRNHDSHFGVVARSCLL